MPNLAFVCLSLAVLRSESWETERLGAVPTVYGAYCVRGRGHSRHLHRAAPLLFVLVLSLTYLNATFACFAGVPAGCVPSPRHRLFCLGMVFLFIWPSQPIHTPA